MCIGCVHGGRCCKLKCMGSYDSSIELGSIVGVLGYNALG